MASCDSPCLTKVKQETQSMDTGDIPIGSPVTDVTATANQTADAETEPALDTVKLLLSVSASVVTQLAAVKEKLKLDTDQTLLHLVGLFNSQTPTTTASEPETSDQSVSKPDVANTFDTRAVDKVVRTALREELSALLKRGFLTVGDSNHSNSDNRRTNREHSSMDIDGYNSHSEAQGTPSKAEIDNSKRRSRKSLPQRLIIDDTATNPVAVGDESGDDDVVEILPSAETSLDTSSGSLGEKVVNDSRNYEDFKDDTEAMLYNYVLEPRPETDQSQALPSQQTVYIGASQLSPPLGLQSIVPESLTKLRSFRPASGHPSASNLQSTRDIPPASDNTTRQVDPEVFSIGEHKLTRQNGQLHCPYCEYRTTVPTRLRRHVTLHTGKGYKCSQCDRTYTEVYKLKEHIQVKHEKSVRYPCEYCKKVFTSKGGLKYHVNTSHNKEFPHWCDLCCKGFMTKDESDDHMTIHSGSFKYRCQVCQKEFSYMAYYKAHMKDCHKAPPNPTREEPMKCDLCGKDFSNLQELNKHAMALHFSGGSPVVDVESTCPEESEATRETTEATSADLSEDEVVVDSEWNGVMIENVESLKDTAKNPFSSTRKTRSSCDVSGQEEMDSSMGKTTPKAKTLVTRFCGVTFTGGKHRVYHVCQYCDYKTFKKSHLKRHEMIHTGKKHKCIECSCSFNEMNKLKYHLKQKHDIEWQEVLHAPKKINPTSAGSTKVSGIHYCDYCSYKTGKPSHMNRHLNIHVGKQFTCQACPKSFNEISKLDNHILLKHEGIVSYVCEDCGKNFTTKGGLQYHVQTKHNNAWKYECKICNKKFNQRQHFRGHKNMHSGKRPYVCSHCGRGFAYHSVLQSHLPICREKKGDNSDVGVAGKYAYKCGACDEVFASVDTFESHECCLEEDGENTNIDKMYVCGCGREFEQRQEYMTHVKCCPELSSGFVIETIGDEESDSQESNNESRTGSTENSLNQPVFPTLELEHEPVN